MRVYPALRPGSQPHPSSRNRSMMGKDHGENACSRIGNRLSARGRLRLPSANRLRKIHRRACRVRQHRCADSFSILMGSPMDVRPIRTDQDHHAALAAIDACWGAPEGSEEGDKLDVLVALVESYEARRWPIDSDKRFDPIDVLHYAIEELGHTQSELAELLGRARVRRNSRSQTRADGRYDPQAWRGVENSGRPSRSALQGR